MTGIMNAVSVGVSFSAETRGKLRNAKQAAINFQHTPDQIHFSAGKTTEKIPKVVIVGNGLGGVATARALNRLLVKNQNLADVVLLGREKEFIFKPMLPDALNSDPASIPMDKVFKSRRFFSPKHAVAFQQATVTEVSLDANKKVLTTSAGDIPFDYLVLAVGGQTQYFNTAGAKENALTLETKADLETIQISIRNKLTHAAGAAPDSDTQNANMTFMIVGAGATGIELAFEMNHYIERLINKEFPALKGVKPNIKLIEATDDILPGFSDREKAYVKKELAEQGIEILYKTSVKEVTEHQGLTLSNKNTEPPTIGTVNTIDPVWVTGVRANALAESMAVERIKGKEQIKVNPFLELPNRPDIYVIGDVSSAIDPSTNRPHPPTGQVAEQQGTFVAQDLFKKLTKASDGSEKTTEKSEARPAFAYKNKGLMLSAGPKEGFANLMDKAFVTGRLASKIRQTVYLRKLNKG